MNERCKADKSVQFQGCTFHPGKVILSLLEENVPMYFSQWNWLGGKRPWYSRDLMQYLIFSGEFPAAIQGCPGRPHLDSAILPLALLLLLGPQQDHLGPHLLPLIVLLLIAPQVHLDFQALLGTACQLVPTNLIPTSVASHLPSSLVSILMPNSLLENDPTMWWSHCKSATSRISRISGSQGS